MTQVLRADHLVGEIVLDEHGKVVDHPSRKAVPEADDKTYGQVLRAVKDPKFFAILRQKNIDLTKKSVRASVSPDILIMQAVSAIEEIDRGMNMMSKRLREWAAWWVPESENGIVDHAAFARLICDLDRELLLSQAGSSSADSMGAELSKTDVDAIKAQAQACREVLASRDRHEIYLKDSMQVVCPNLNALAGHMIGAKLIVHAGGLKHLSELPSSTIQLLGAEKALFRHLKTGAKPPKHGLICNHPLVQSSRRADMGRVARALADKISIAVKVDYFKGQFIGDSLRSDLEKRFKR